ncbi:MAG TPA: trigger factor [Bacteroidales bacterium]|nr:trigger factor [Bacteroidales bacterium]
MNISKQNVDELNAKIKLSFGKEDYEEKVKKSLNDYRKKINMPGFRPGHVPMGLVEKMYRKPVLIEEVNKLISESLYNYIKEQNLDILGDPIPSETDNKTIDFDNNTEFEFTFDIALTPSFEISWTKKDKITSYTIPADDTAINKQIEYYARRFGKFVTAEVAEKESSITGNLAEVDEKGNLVENGHVAEGVTIYLDLAKDDAEINAFIGAKVGDIVKFDIKKAFPNNVELANLLKVEKHEVDAAPSHFQMTIGAISKFESAAVEQDLFDKVYKAGEVKSEEEFRAKIKDEVENFNKMQVKYRFANDAKKLLTEKVNFSLPEEFLKRWLLSTNEGKITKEQIEQEFPMFAEGLKWQIIKNKISKDNGFKVEETEIKEMAKEEIRIQFLNYGITNMDDEHLEYFIAENMKKEESVRRYVTNVIEQKVVDYVRQNATVEEKEISQDEYAKLA